VGSCSFFFCFFPFFIESVSLMFVIKQSFHHHHNHHYNHFLLYNYLRVDSDWYACNITQGMPNVILWRWKWEEQQQQQQISFGVKYILPAKPEGCWIEHFSVFFRVNLITTLDAKVRALTHTHAIDAVELSNMFFQSFAIQIQLWFVRR